MATHQRRSLGATKRALTPPLKQRSLKTVKRETSPHRRPPHPGEAERIAARRLKAFALRRAGHSYPDIAKALRCAVGTAYEDVTAELLDIRTKTHDDVEAVRQMELERCDLVIKHQWAQAKRGNHKAALAIIRAMDHRAKLLGLYAPSELKVEGSMTLDVFAVARREIESRLARLAERASASGVPELPGS